MVVCKSVRGLAAVHSESSLQQARGLADPLWDDMSKRGVQLSLRNRATLLVIWKRIKSHRKSAVCCVTNVYVAFMILYIELSICFPVMSLNSHE